MHAVAGFRGVDRHSGAPGKMSPWGPHPPLHYIMAVACPVGSPNIPKPGNTYNSPVCTGSALGPPPTRPCPEELPGELTRWHPYKLPESPWRTQRDPMNPLLSSVDGRRNPAEMPYFSSLSLQACSVS